MVTTFFDNITKLSDHFTFSFVEELKKDVITNFLIYRIDWFDYLDSLPECKWACSVLYLSLDATKKTTTSFWFLCEHSTLL